MMNKAAGIGMALACSLLLCGCTPGRLVETITGRLEPGDGSISDVTPAPHASRVYMDEVEGVMSGFDGSHLAVLSEEEEYIFDVSQASVECAGGLLGGDEISVIYEGRLNGQDTGSVKALKVTDALHKKNRPKEYTLNGQIKTVTPWSVTVLTSDGNQVQCPTAGRPLYFSRGLISGNPVVIHLIGELPSSADALGGAHLNILSVSDQDPPAYTEKEPEVQPQITDPYSQLQRMRLSIEAISGQEMAARPDRSDIVLKLDLSRFPVYLPGGCLPGTAVYMYYYGSFNGKDLTGLTIDQLRGVNPASQNTADILCHVDGTVAGVTSDTLTLLCADGSLFTCRRRTSMGGQLQDPQEGETLRVTLQPGSVQDTNVYTAMRVERI